MQVARKTTSGIGMVVLMVFSITGCSDRGKKDGIVVKSGGRIPTELSSNNWEDNTISLYMALDRCVRAHSVTGLGMNSICSVWTMTGRCGDTVCLRKNESYDGFSYSNMWYVVANRRRDEVWFFYGDATNVGSVFGPVRMRDAIIALDRGTWENDRVGYPWNPVGSTNNPTREERHRSSAVESPR